MAAEAIHPAVQWEVPIEAEAAHIHQAADTEQEALVVAVADTDDQVPAVTDQVAHHHIITTGGRVCHRHHIIIITIITTITDIADIMIMVQGITEDRLEAAVVLLHLPQFSFS